MTYTRESTSFDDYVKQLDALYQTRGRTLRLRPPARKKTLTKVGRVIEGPLDPDLHAAWLVADGAMEEESPFFARPDFLTAFDFLSAEDALLERDAMAKRAPSFGNYQQEEVRDKRVLDGWFSPAWLPFAGFGAGSLLLISDSSPSKHGKVGQIIGYIHDPDEIVYIAPSFGRFLTASIRALKSDADEYFFSLDERG